MFLSGDRRHEVFAQFAESKTELHSANCAKGLQMQKAPSSVLSHSDHSIDRRIAAKNIVPGENQVFIDSDYSQIEQAGLTHHNSETGSYGKFHILSKPRLLLFSFATFR